MQRAVGRVRGESTPPGGLPETGEGVGDSNKAGSGPMGWVCSLLPGGMRGWLSVLPFLAEITSLWPNERDR